MCVRKEAGPVCAQGGNSVPGLGLVIAGHRGWLGAAVGFGTEGLGFEGVPRVRHYWVTTPFQARAVVWAKLGHIRTGLRAVQCQGDGSQTCVCLCVCLWVGKASRLGSRSADFVFLPRCLAAVNTDLPQTASHRTRLRLQRFVWILPWYVCTYTLSVYMHSLICVYLCIFTCAHQHECTWLCVYVYVSVLGESLEYLSTD